ncbi:hypothetical protein KEM54_000606 [Ascosphaera aggregata]|nr:hypothetical protein KEM54_000606 [Ascosphaera aggregata]
MSAMATKPVEEWRNASGIHDNTSVRVFDAHCHPTEVMDSVERIPKLRAAGLTIMSTRQEDQELTEEAARKYGGGLAIDGQGDGKVVPCFGWHPWFSHTVIDDVRDHEGAGMRGEDRKIAHYTAVLQPTPHYSENEEDRMFIDGLPEPFPLSQLITGTRDRLKLFPAALVGEIGLDKSFRIPYPWPVGSDVNDAAEVYGNLTAGTRAGRALSRFRTRMTHQKAIFETQLHLAGELGRAVSVHSVGGHGAVLEVLTGLCKGHERLSKRQQRREAQNSHVTTNAERIDCQVVREQKNEFRTFPPRVCMHSYSGPSEQLVQFFHPSVPIDIYFSFSTFVNFNQKSEAQAKKIADIIRAIPDDRILVETDLHVAGDEMDDALEKVAKEVFRVRGWDLKDGERRLNENWRKFVFG